MHYMNYTAFDWIVFDDFKIQLDPTQDAKNDFFEHIDASIILLNPARRVVKAEFYQLKDVAYLSVACLYCGLEYTRMVEDIDSAKAILRNYAEWLYHVKFDVVIAEGTEENV